MSVAVIRHIDAQVLVLLTRQPEVQQVFPARITQKLLETVHATNLHTRTRHAIIVYCRVVTRTL
jgi:hypothetical protein